MTARIASNARAFALGAARVLVPTLFGLGAMLLLWSFAGEPRTYDVQVHASSIYTVKVGDEYCLPEPVYLDPPMEVDDRPIDFVCTVRLELPLEDDIRLAWGIFCLVSAMLIIAMVKATLRTE